MKGASMKIFHNIWIALLVLFFSVIIFGYSIFHYELSGPSDDNSLKVIEIEPGGISEIAATLKEEDLIKNELFFKVYVKLTGKTNLKAGTYSLSEDMGVAKIVDILENGSSSNQLAITFKEGLSMRKIAKVIEENTNNSEDMVYSLLKDREYLNTLIGKYWFLSDAILDDGIYYSLEGYLYPSTYHFGSEDTTVEVIIETMLDEMEKQLADYKDSINNNTNSFHDILTLASIVELEGVTLEDRKSIAGVFYNRLNSNMNLGSDVTTYYGALIDMGDRDLYSSEVNECNNYNTRCATFKTLPISPICNPSIDSILAVLEPDNNDYYYFVADKNRKVYFSNNINEHNNTITKLKNNDLWYEY